MLRISKRKNKAYKNGDGISSVRNSLWEIIILVAPWYEPWILYSQNNLDLRYHIQNIPWPLSPWLLNKRVSYRRLFIKSGFLWFPSFYRENWTNVNVIKCFKEVKGAIKQPKRLYFIGAHLFMRNHNFRNPPGINPESCTARIIWIWDTIFMI